MIERLFASIVDGDANGVLDLLHPGVEWTPTVWSGEAMYRGHEGVHLWLSQFGEDFEHLNIQVEKVVIERDRGAALGTVFDTRGNQTFVVKVAWSFEIEGDLIRCGRAHGSWEEAVAAARLAGELAQPSLPAPEPRAARGTLGRVRQALRPNPECPVGRHFCRFSRG